VVGEIETIRFPKVSGDGETIQKEKIKGGVKYSIPDSLITPGI